MKIRHLSEEKLLELALDLSGDTMARSHLETCQTCLAEIRTLRSASEALEAFPPLSPSLSLASRTLEAVERAGLQDAVESLSISERAMDWFGSFGRSVAGPVPAALLAAAALAVGIVPRISTPSSEKSSLQREQIAPGMSAHVPALGSPERVLALKENQSGRSSKNAPSGGSPALPDPSSRPERDSETQVASELKPVGQDRSPSGGLAATPLYSGGSGAQGPARSSAGTRASSGQGEGELGVIGVELKILGNSVRVETGEKARVLLKVRASIRVIVEVYSSTGGRAASLLDAVLEPGQREISWDGRANSGTPVASGVYVLAIHGTGFSETVKVLVLK